MLPGMRVNARSELVLQDPEVPELDEDEEEENLEVPDAEDDSEFVETKATYLGWTKTYRLQKPEEIDKPKLLKALAWKSAKFEMALRTLPSCGRNRTWRPDKNARALKRMRAQIEAADARLLRG